jgi:hypothetical protein
MSRTTNNVGSARAISPGDVDLQTLSTPLRENFASHSLSLLCPSHFLFFFILQKLLWGDNISHDIEFDIRCKNIIDTYVGRGNQHVFHLTNSRLDKRARHGH